MVVKLILEVSPEEFDKVSQETLHATSVTDLVIKQGLLSVTQRITSISEVGVFARKQWGVPVETPAILVYTAREEEQDGDDSRGASGAGAGELER